MNSDVVLSVILLTGWLILVGAGVWRRGQPIGKVAMQAAIWVGIIGLMWVVATIGFNLRRS